MKKLMMALAVVAVAAVAQAASIDWAVTGNTWYYKDGTTKAAAGTPVYLINAADWSTIKTAIEGGKTAFTTSDKGILAVGATSNAKGAVSGTATSAALTAGTSYTYAYLVFDTRDANNIQYFASGTLTEAAYDKTDPVFNENTSITFNATAYTTGQLSSGWTAAAPEPTSGLLLLLGMAGLALKRKRA